MVRTLNLPRLKVTPRVTALENSAPLRGITLTRWCRSCRDIAVILILLTRTRFDRGLQKWGSRPIRADPLVLDVFIRVTPLLGSVIKLRPPRTGLVGLQLKAMPWHLICLAMGGTLPVPGSLCMVGLTLSSLMTWLIEVLFRPNLSQPRTKRPIGLTSTSVVTMQSLKEVFARPFRETR